MLKVGFQCGHGLYIYTCMYVCAFDRQVMRLEQFRPRDWKEKCISGGHNQSLSISISGFDIMMTWVNAGIRRRKIKGADHSGEEHVLVEIVYLHCNIGSSADGWTSIGQLHCHLIHRVPHIIANSLSHIFNHSNLYLYMCIRIENRKPEERNTPLTCHSSEIREKMEPTRAITKSHI